MPTKSLASLTLCQLISISAEPGEQGEADVGLVLAWPSTGKNRPGTRHLGCWATLEALGNRAKGPSPKEKSSPSYASMVGLDTAIVFALTHLLKNGGIEVHRIL